MESEPQNRKAPIPQDSESLLRLVQDAREALARLETVARMMPVAPPVKSVEVANFWIFHDGINAILKFTESAGVAVREAKLNEGAYNAAGAPIPKRKPAASSAKKKG